MATLSQWTPFGVALDLTATGSSVTRTSATQFTVKIVASWKTHYSGAKTNYGMKVTSGGKTVVISSFGTSRSNGSYSFVGTYSISGNGSASKLITVTFTNYEKDSKGNVTESASKSMTFNVTVPAWTSYTITYNANGGSGAPGKQTKWKDQALTLSSTKPTRSGWTFMGWGTTTTDTTVNYAAGASYTANAGITLYAIWRKAITLTYNGNVGDNINLVSGVPSASTAYIYNAETSYRFSVSATKPKRSNYTFVGWGTSKSALVATHLAGSNITVSSNTTLYAVWKISYVPPKIGKITVTRTSTSTSTITGTAKSSVNVSFAWETFKSNPKVTVECLDNSGTTTLFTNETDLSGPSGTYACTIGDDSLIVSNTYLIRVTIDDGGGSISRTATVPAITYPIHFKPGGKGTAIGKPAEFDNTFDVAWLTRLRDNLCVGSTSDDNPYIAFLKGYNTEPSIKIQLDGSNNLKLLGASDIYFGTKGRSEYRPYYTKGDVITVSINTAGYVTNSGKDVSFTVPLSKPAISVTSVIAAPVSGITVRQDGKYGFGSSATSETTAGDYSSSAVLSGGNHVRVTVKFTNTDNAVNNAAAGIFWSGTLTFA